MRRNIKQYSSSEEDEILLKVSYKDDTIKVTKPSYEQLFIMNVQLVKENEKLRECNLGLKESLKSFEEVDKCFKIEITKV